MSELGEFIYQELIKAGVYPISSNYLIIYGSQAFYTNHYDYENLYADGMIVINFANDTISFNGKDFNGIEEDHL